MKRILFTALLALPLGAYAQTINFDAGAQEYTALGVYDTWEDSPFRTGELRGNTAVVANPAPSDHNSTANVLAVQRSRFGSNTFGARIDLAETFELTPTEQYVHVLINKPTEGRVMLIGLGKRRERADQSREAEQFWSLSRTKMVAGEWTDAVFPIKGAGGIDIYSLVVVPDCESPHDLTADYMCYIDEIEFSDNILSRTSNVDYPLNFERDATYTRTNRHLRTISLGSQTFDVTTTVSTTNPVYTDLMPKSFLAKAGETLTPTFGYTGAWMSGYVYVDYGNDGRFDTSLNDNGTPAEGSDVVAYAFYKNRNSAGSYVANGNVLNPPSFTLPAGTPTGFYRMRYKVDWDEIDAGGNASSGNFIIDNGGAVVDVRLNVHEDVVTVNDANRNGEVLASDGTKLDSYRTPFGESFTIRMNPENGFTYDGIRLRHGYNLSGDSLVHGTPQYVDVIIPASEFTDDQYTIPADYVDGDILIEGLFVEEAKLYPVAFDKEADRSGSSYQERFITSVGLDDQVVKTEDQSLVYHDLTAKVLAAKPGAQVLPTIGFTDTWMNTYVYIDKGRNGKFDVAAPAARGALTEANELVSFSGLTLSDGTRYNSAGTQLSNLSVVEPPVFTLPAGLEPGFYMMRYKVDWDNYDPAGRVGDDNDIIKNGGGIADIRLFIHDGGNANVRATAQYGTLQTVGGEDLNGLSVPYGEPLIFVAECDEDHRLAGLQIRHGDLAATDSVVNGVAQYVTDYLDLASELGPRYTIPAGYFDGDVVIQAVYTDALDDDYVLVYDDEFEQPDGSQPDPERWSSSERRNATWNRYVADDDRVVFIEDGALVCRAIPNPDTSADDVPMLTGARETKDKFSFTYGYVEVRLKTTRHTGNFPAAWMMPQPPTQGWPAGGEIDIFETIDNQNHAWHTVHSNWTQTLGHRNDPKSSFDENVTVEDWHVYGLEWTEDKLTWFVDGTEVGSYAKSDDPDALENGQWPFDAPFYLILNQSVGSGAWAANPDTNFTYETRFDYVRVYQRRTTGLSQATVAADGAAAVYDLQGRRVLTPQKGHIYIRGGRKFIAR